MENPRRSEFQDKGSFKDTLGKMQEQFTPDKNTFSKFAGYFFQGLILIAPIAVSVYILYAVFIKINSLIDIESLVGIHIPGLNFLIIIVLVTLLGFMGSRLVAQPILNLLESVLMRTPVLKFLYSSTKDFIEAFLGEKKKFTEPVLVNMEPGMNIQRIGFITSKSLAELGLHGKVAVYLPHSYAFSGDLFIVPANQVIPVRASSGEVMKFIVSGGVTDFDALTDVSLPGTDATPDAGIRR